MLDIYPVFSIRNWTHKSVCLRHARTSKTLNVNGAKTLAFSCFSYCFKHCYNALDTYVFTHRVVKVNDLSSNCMRNWVKLASGEVRRARVLRDIKTPYIGFLLRVIYKIMRFWGLCKASFCGIFLGFPVDKMCVIGDVSGCLRYKG